MLNEGIGVCGSAGTADWTIDRRGIAVAMAQGGSFKMQSQMGQKTDQDKTLHVAKSCDSRQRVDANEDSISRRSAFVQCAG